MKAKEFLSDPSGYRNAFDSERENRKLLSPVGIMARSLATQARGEIVTFVNDYARKHWDSYNAVIFDDLFYSEARKVVGEEVVAVHFASALMALEQTIVTGGYYIQDHIDITNNILVGLPMYQVALSGEPKKQNVGYRKMREMWKVAKKDPTLTAFFDTSKDLLPEEMKSYLEVSGLLQYFPLLLTEYITFADNFVFHFDNSARNEERFTAVQQEVLARFDHNISMVSCATAGRISNWVGNHGLDKRPLG